jgi:hypothetical protein
MELLALYSKGPRQGKSTLAGLLEEKYEFTRISFADPGRVMLKSLATVVGADWEKMLVDRDWVDPKLSFSYRQGMTTLLHEWGRLQINYDIWVSLTSRVIEKLVDTGKEKIVIDDLRYPNEEAMVSKRGGKIIQVERPGMVYAESIMGHASESQTVSADYTIRNLREPVEMLLQLEILGIV